MILIIISLYWIYSCTF